MQHIQIGVLNSQSVFCIIKMIFSKEYRVLRGVAKAGGKRK
jgi:hypothetical protein